MLKNILSRFFSQTSPETAKAAAAGDRLDCLAIGDITTDAFIRLPQAEVHCPPGESTCQLCLSFADKVPFESVTIVKGVGNSANAAVAIARLGLSSALACSVGDDQNGQDCIDNLTQNNVSTKYVNIEKGAKTNYHYVLWYGDERTILVKQEHFATHFPALPTGAAAPKWIYLSSLGESSEEYHAQIADYLEHNPEVKLAFQPGTFQMKLGVEKLKRLYQHSELFIVNVEESQRILGTTETDLKILLAKIAALGPKIVCITDGPKGAYMLDTRDAARTAYFIPIYPDPKPPYERTGCGDSFASTFVAALIYGKTPLEAFEWAPINPMSVVQYIGAQQGLLTKPALEELYSVRPATYKTSQI